MASLHIDSVRIIEGPIRARILYFLNGIQCGAPNAFNVQLLRVLLNGALRRDEQMVTTKVKKKGMDHQNNVILIKRSSKRHFKFYKEIHDMLKRLESRFPFTVKTFSDEQLPSLVETKSLFHDAVMILGTEHAIPYQL